MGCRSKKALVITGVVGVILCLVGGALLWGFAIFTKNTVIKDTMLIPGTTSYETWVQPPVPLIMQYWVWDLQNPDEFLNGETPIVEQKGPYTYLEYRIKTNITHNHENGTVSFRNSKVYIFDRSQSVGDEWDKFTTFNVPVFTVANLLKNAALPIKNIQKFIHAVSGATSVLEISVHDILWGYEDEYLKLFDQLFPGLLPTTEFGLFQGTNNTDDGEWVEYTGETSFEDVGQVISWDGYTSLPYWSNEWANMLNGSDGTVTTPFVEVTDDVYFFIPDICRSGYLQFEYYYKLRGIAVGRFSAPSFLYADADEYPDNIGFCTPPGGTCAPTGLVNATECQSGAPIYYSSPHFLYGTESLFEGVIGPEPVEEEHKVFFDIEMMTGIIFQVANRLQVNLRVDPYEWVDDTVLIKQAYVPLVWLNESSAIDQASADFFIGSIQLPLLIAQIMIVVLLAVGGGMVVGALVTAICWHCSDKPKSIDMQELTAEGSYKSPEKGFKEVAT